MTDVKMNKDMLQKCPHCGSTPMVSENNVPGNWYGYITCENSACEERPSVCYGGSFDSAIEEVAEWNRLPVVIEPAHEVASRERQIVAMAKVLEECRHFNSGNPAMEVRSLVWATRLWEAAHNTKSPVQYGSKFDCHLVERMKTEEA
jgi:hypothetical protein